MYRSTGGSDFGLVPEGNMPFHELDSGFEFVKLKVILWPLLKVTLLTTILAELDTDVIVMLRAVDARTVGDVILVKR